MLRHIPLCDLDLLYMLRFLCLILASYVDVAYFEMKLFMQPSCLCAIAPRVQGDVLWRTCYMYSWLLCILSTQFTSYTFGKTHKTGRPRQTQKGPPEWVTRKVFEV